jgi:Holliday junction resolvase RusA-like endonuclease
MIRIELNERPVPWAAPKLSRFRTYDPRETDKRAIRYLIRQQYTGEPLKGYVGIFFVFLFRPPKSASKKSREAMLRHEIIPTKSDCTNLQKLYEDCLKKIVIEDDRNVEYISSIKLYGEKDKVIITVYPT